MHGYPLLPTDGGDEAGQAAVVGERPGIGKSVRGEQSAGLCGEAAVDFQVQLAAGDECGVRVSGYGAIEHERVVVGDEECSVRLVIEYV